MSVCNVNYVDANTCGEAEAGTACAEALQYCCVYAHRMCNDLMLFTHLVNAKRQQHSNRETDRE